jgi:hypothetical protein
LNFQEALLPQEIEVTQMIDLSRPRTAFQTAPLKTRHCGVCLTCSVIAVVYEVEGKMEST